MPTTATGLRSSCGTATATRTRPGSGRVGAGCATRLRVDQPDGSLLNPASGMCLDAASNGTGNETPLQLWDCNGDWNQIWNQHGDGTIVSPQANRCADIADALYTNGTRIQTWNCNAN